MLCGPGNNGGDGLVAARHLKQFGHLPTVFYPKKIANDLFERLALQANSAGVAFASADTVIPGAMNETHVDLIIDGLFGFSFVGPPREPFVSLLAKLSATSIPVVSIDIPSGWEVDSVPTDSPSSFRPAAVVSLTAPKFCMQGFAGAHYLGLRQLLSKDIAARVGVDVQQLTPSSRDSAQFIRLDKSENKIKTDSNDGRIKLTLVTAPNPEVARTIATALVNEKIAAYVNILPAVTSVYRWQGQLQSDSETLLIIKANSSSTELLQQRVKKLHPYDLPEIIHVPIAGGLEDYISWVEGGK